MDKVTYFHIPVENMERAMKFYKSIFGWEIEETVAGMDYQLAKTVAVDEKDVPKEPGAINGALYSRESPDDCQSIMISVPSIDEYLKKIEKAGGMVIGHKSPVEDFGFYARVADTEGNVIGLWEDIR